MTEVPNIPDEFDSEEELKTYIDQLHDQIEFLEEELEESEKEKLELKQDLNELEEKASTGSHPSSDLEEMTDMAKQIADRLDSIELHGGPSDVGLTDSLRDGPR